MALEDVLVRAATVRTPEEAPPPRPPVSLTSPGSAQTSSSSSSSSSNHHHHPFGSDGFDAKPPRPALRLVPLEAPPVPEEAPEAATEGEAPPSAGETRGLELLGLTPADLVNLSPETRAAL